MQPSLCQVLRKVFEVFERMKLRNNEDRWNNDGNIGLSIQDLQ